MAQTVDVYLVIVSRSPKYIIKKIFMVNSETLSCIQYDIKIDFRSVRKVSTGESITTQLRCLPDLFER